MSEWFEQKEESAGVKRLLLSWWLYKIFGVIPLRIIAFFVILFGYIGMIEQKEALKTYFENLSEYTKNKKYKPSFLNKFKIFLNYANSLVDKIQGFAGDYKNLVFENDEVKTEISNLLKNKQGIFFITNHIGNVELMRTLLLSKVMEEKPRVNIFLQKNHCEIFNTFLEKIAVKTNVSIYPVEDIDIDTSVEVQEKLKNGEIVFMAGDRLSAKNVESFYEAEILNRKVKLPIGVLKFAQMLDSEIYFVTCAKNIVEYEILAKRFEKENSKTDTIQKLQKEYASFLQSSILKYPYQFYHFSKFFE